jgi:phage host-nuclease inhibitor protein Gam
MVKQIQSFDEVDKKLLELAQHESFIAKKEADMNSRIQSTKQKFDNETADARAQKQLLEQEIHSFCLRNKTEFIKQRAKKLIHGSVGFRTNPPKVNQLNRKYSIKTSLEFLKKLYDGKYVRLKEEVDKEKLLADYSTEVLDDDNLASVGLRVDQDETFYCEIDWETIKSDAQNQSISG